MPTDRFSGGVPTETIVGYVVRGPGAGSHDRRVGTHTVVHTPRQRPLIECERRAEIQRPLPPAPVRVVPSPPPRVVRSPYPTPVPMAPARQPTPVVATRQPTPVVPPAQQPAPVMAAPPRPRRGRQAARWLIVLGIPVAGALGLSLQDGEAAAPHAPATETAAVTRGPLVVRVVETGRVEPGQQAQIRSRVGGIVVGVEVEEGQLVKTGQPLLRLDPTDYQRAVERTAAEVQENQAQLRLARWRQQSTRQAIRQRVVSQAEMRAADTDVTLAQARLRAALAAHATAKDQVGYTTVVAPFDGRVIARNVQPGEAVTPGMSATAEGRPLLVLANTVELVVRVDLNQIDFSRIAMGQSAKVSLDSIPGRHFAGKVISRAASSMIASGGADVLPIKVRLDSGQDISAVTPGMVADVEIEVANKAGVLLLPIEAISFSGNQKLAHVWSSSAGRFESRPVKTGLYDDQKIEILAGLTEGARVQLGAPVADDKAK